MELFFNFFQIFWEIFCSSLDFLSASRAKEPPLGFENRLLNNFRLNGMSCKILTSRILAFFDIFSHFFHFLTFILIIQIF